MDEIDRECLAELPEVLALIPVEERGKTDAILKEMRTAKLVVNKMIPAFRKLIDEATGPLLARITELESRDGASASSRARRRRAPLPPPAQD